jgi:chitinase
MLKFEVLKYNVNGGRNMKKLLILMIILIAGLVGCTEKDIEPVSLDYVKIQDIGGLIDLLSTPITEDDRLDIEKIRAMYNSLTDEEKVLITNLDILENAEAVIAGIDAKNAETNAIIEEMEVYFDELIPEVVEDHLDLPTKHQTKLGEFKIMWGSSDPFSLSNKGHVIRGRKGIRLQLTTTFILGDIRTSFNQEVTVRGMTFAPLPKSRLAIGYYYNNSSFEGFSEIALKTLDVVNYGFAKVTESGGLVNILPLSKREEVLEARRHGVRILLCIAGYANEAIPFSKLAMTPEGRTKFAKSIVDAIEKYHYDGIDIDWEYPGFYTEWAIDQTTDTRNYTLLMAEIRRQVKAANPDYIVSAAIPGGRWLPIRFNLSDLNSVLDFFNIMTYDMADSTISTHHTALYKSSYTPGGSSIQETVDYYINQGVSKSKIVIGAAFYGREFTLSTTDRVMYASASSSKNINYNIIETTYLNRLDTSVFRYWDEVAKAPYLHDTINNKVVVYDDAESLKYKSEYIIDKGLGGLMFWEYTQDNTGKLLTSIYDNLVKNR